MEAEVKAEGTILSKHSNSTPENKRKTVELNKIEGGHHSLHSDTVNIEPLTSTTTAIYFHSIFNKHIHPALLVLTAHCCLLV